MKLRRLELPPMPLARPIFIRLASSRPLAAGATRYGFVPAIFGILFWVVILVAGVVTAPASRGAPTNSSGGAITGSFDEWIGAVCLSGKASIREDEDFGVCEPRPSPSYVIRDEAVRFMWSDSVDSMVHLLSLMPIGYFTRAIDDQTGHIVVFYELQHDAQQYEDTPLKPLERFGFIIQRMPGRT